MQVVLVRKANEMENTLRHECQNTCAVPMRSMILWKVVSWRFEVRFVRKIVLYATVYMLGKPKRYKCEDHWDGQNHRENQTKTRKPRFQDQQVAKTIEKTKKNKEKQAFRINGQPKPSRKQYKQQKTKTKQTYFRTNDSGSRSLVLKYYLLYVCWFSPWFWILVDSEILVLLVCLVFSMVLATH